MKLYQPTKTRGYWSFSNNAELDFDELGRYLDFYEDLEKLMEILNRHQLLMRCNIAFEDGNSIEIKGRTIKEQVEFIRQLGDLGSVYMYGDTAINTGLGIETYTGLFTIAEMRMGAQDIFLETKTDVWLPMAFDAENHSFEWNLERYRLNKDRIEKALDEIERTFQWKENSKHNTEHNDLGAIQKGYKLFLSEEVITMQFEKKPNPDFDLEEYLAEIRNAAV